MTSKTRWFALTDSPEFTSRREITPETGQISSASSKAFLAIASWASSIEA